MSKLLIYQLFKTYYSLTVIDAVIVMVQGAQEVMVSLNCSRQSHWGYFCDFLKKKLSVRLVGTYPLDQSFCCVYRGKERSVYNWSNAFRSRTPQLTQGLWLVERLPLSSPANHDKTMFMSTNLPLHYFISIKSLEVLLKCNNKYMFKWHNYICNAGAAPCGCEPNNEESGPIGYPSWGYLWTLGGYPCDWGTWGPNTKGDPSERFWGWYWGGPGGGLSPCVGAGGACYSSARRHSSRYAPAVPLFHVCHLFEDKQYLGSYPYVGITIARCDDTFLN